MSAIALVSRKYYEVSAVVGHLASVAALAARAYISWVFFASGLTKIRDWDTTLFLFEEEYSVPLLSPEVAAWLATAGELLLPVLLLLGLLTRFSAAGLFIINIVAVISLESIPAAALYLHYVWGILLLQLLVWGAGKLSADAFLAPRLGVNKDV